MYVNNKSQSCPSESPYACSDGLRPPTLPRVRARVCTWAYEPVGRMGVLTSTGSSFPGSVPIMPRLVAEDTLVVGQPTVERDRIHI